MSRSKSRVLLIPCRVDSDWVQPMAVMPITPNVVNSLLARMERVEGLKTEGLGNVSGIQYFDASIYLIDAGTLNVPIFERLEAVQRTFEPDEDCVFDGDSRFLFNTGLADLATCKAIISTCDVFWVVHTTGEKRVRTALVSKFLLEKLRASMAASQWAIECCVTESGAVITRGNYVVFGADGERIAGFAMEEDAKAFKELKERG